MCRALLGIVGEQTCWLQFGLGTRTLGKAIYNIAKGCMHELFVSVADTSHDMMVLGALNFGGRKNMPNLFQR